MENEHPTMEEDIQNRVRLDEEIAKLERVRACIQASALDNETKVRWICRVADEIAKRV